MSSLIGSSRNRVREFLDGHLVLIREMITCPVTTFFIQLLAKSMLQSFDHVLSHIYLLFQPLYSYGEWCLGITLQS